IHIPRARPCARAAYMASWHRLPNSRASPEFGRLTTSPWLAEWSRLFKMVTPLLTNRKFRASPVALWIVTKHYPAPFISKVARPDTSLFGISPSHLQCDLQLTDPRQFVIQIDQPRVTCERNAQTHRYGQIVARCFRHSLRK